jgi:mannose-6-phosphate isomerase-like protein (cupin superfamily)
MEESTRDYLGAEVQVRRLGPASGGGRFMAEDIRGRVAFPVVAEPFEYMHIVEFARAGVRRGLHAHPHHEEHFLVFRGELRLAARSASSRETVLIELTEGHLVRMAPGVAHALESCGPGTSVHFGRGSNPITDTIQVPELGVLFDLHPSGGNMERDSSRVG